MIAGALHDYDKDLFLEGEEILIEIMEIISDVSSGLFYKHGLTVIPAWISNYIHYNAWDEITYPFLNFNGATVEV